MAPYCGRLIVFDLQKALRKLTNIFQHGVLLYGQVVFDFQLCQQLVVQTVHDIAVPSYHSFQLKEKITQFY